jgi:hypothetical protein
MLEGVVHKRAVCSIEDLASFFAKMRGARKISVL